MPPQEGDSEDLKEEWPRAQASGVIILRMATWVHQ